MIINRKGLDLVVLQWTCIPHKCQKANNNKIMYIKKKKRKTKSSENLGQRQLHWRIQWKLRCPQQEMIIVWFWIGGRNTSTFFFHFFFLHIPQSCNSPFGGCHILVWHLSRFSVHLNGNYAPQYCPPLFAAAPTMLEVLELLAINSQPVGVAGGGSLTPIRPEISKVR